MAPSPLPPPSPPLLSSSSESKRKRAILLAKLIQCDPVTDHRDQPLLNQAPCKEGPHIECDVNTADLGEVIHPEVSTHCASGSLELEGVKVKLRDANCESRLLLRIKAPGKEGGRLRIGSGNDGRNSVFGDPGETETSPKLCGDKSPVSKLTKVGRGSRGGKASAGHRKKGMLSNREVSKNDPPKGKVRNGCRKGFGGATCRDSRCVAASNAFDLHCTSDKIVGSFLNEVEQHDKQDGSDAKPSVKIPSPTGRAWMKDDVSRPTCLPSLKKQQNLIRTPPTKYGNTPCPLVPDVPPADVSSPCQCPICIEDLDSTDSSFDPCPCGFRLCLFCYHKIASDDGRCPGCRQTYEQRIFH